MLKRISVIFSILLFYFFLSPAPSLAQNNFNVYLFWGNGCPHCAKIKPFLEKMEKKYQSIKVYDYEIWYDDKSRDLFKKVEKKLNTDITGIPFTVIGDETFVGYFDDESSGKEIEVAIKYCLDNTCPDIVKEASANTDLSQKPTNDPGSSSSSPDQPARPGNETKKADKIPDTIKLPIIGSIRVKDVSLPILTIMIAGADGFNPCAMWTLLFLINLLIGMHNKKRMWVLGSVFIAASALVYFMFMAAWLNIILFIGFIFWIRVAIGIIGLGAGYYNLKEYFTNKDGTCKVTSNPQRRKVFDALKKFAQEKHFLIALAGIILLAAAVNLVELVCSAGFPVVYTNILSLSKLNAWEYYMYLLLYILIFMLDDLFVFVVSMLTLQATGMTGRYSRYSHLVGGILMTVLGLILLFKPELLMFG